jgi:hypothetical protein
MLFHNQSRNLRDLVKSRIGEKSFWIPKDPHKSTEQKKLLTRSVCRLFLFFLMRFLTRVDFSCLQKDAVRGGLGSPSIPSKRKKYSLPVPRSSAAVRGTESVLPLSLKILNPVPWYNVRMMQQKMVRKSTVADPDLHPDPNP